MKSFTTYNKKWEASDYIFASIMVFLLGVLAMLPVMIIRDNHYIDAKLEKLEFIYKYADNPIVQDDIVQASADGILSVSECLVIEQIIKDKIIKPGIVQRAIN